MGQDLRSLGAADPRALSWFDTWIRAVTKPSMANFEEIARDPGASLDRSYLWVALAVLVSSVIGTVTGYLQISQVAQGFRTILLLFAFRRDLPDLVVAIAWGLIIFTLETGAIEFVATRLGGTGAFGHIAHAFSAIIVPLSIITSLVRLLGIDPALSYIVVLLDFACGVYGIVLLVTAVKAVYRLGWGSAVLSALALPILAAILVGGVMAVSIASFGPVTGDVSSNVPEWFLTAVP